MRRVVARAGRAARTKVDAAGDLSAADRALLERLKAWRLAEARTQGVPAYVILHDRTLAAIAQTRPADPDALGTVGGIGAAKLARYGDAILAVVVGGDAAP
jgi:ATP-dependent DNA helicase RecQ